MLLSGARVSIGRQRNEVFGGLGYHPVVWEVPDVSEVTSLHSTLSVSFSRFIRRELCFLPNPQDRPCSWELFPYTLAQTCGLTECVQIALFTCVSRGRLLLLEF